MFSSGRLRALLPLAALLVVAQATPAAAYDFNVESLTVGQAYQVRAFRISGDTLLNRRRLTTALHLNVWNIVAPPKLRLGDDVAKPHATLSFVSYLRYSADFGDFLEDSAINGNKTADNPGIPELGSQQRQLDVVYAYLEGKDFFGFLDFRAGRQITSDVLDWYSFDGVTVRARTPLFVTLEASAGLEVRGDLAVSSPLYDLDGVGAGSLLGQHLAPTFGGALELDGPRWAHVRLSYRRTSSAGLTGNSDVDRDLQQAGLTKTQEVIEDKLGLSARAMLFKGALVPYGGARLNLLVNRFDQIQGGTRVALGKRHALTGEYERSVPTWDGDSIFNVFTQYPYDDARLTYDLTVGCIRAYLRAMGRWYHNHACQHGGTSVDIDCPNGDPITAVGQYNIATTVPDFGGGAGVRVDRGQASVRTDLYYLDGFGGLHAGADVWGQWRTRARRLHLPGEALTLDGRLTLVDFDNDQQSAQHGISLGAQGGASWLFHPGMAAHLWVEENVNRFYPSQLRVIGVLDLSYWP